MGSKKGGGSRSSSAPKPPKPKNEWFYEDGVLRSSRVYDKKKGGYTSQTFSTDDERAIKNQGTEWLAGLMKDIPNIMDMSPEGIQGYKDAFTEPQYRALNESYNNALGSAKSAASSSGMRNSIGFNKYLADQIERNRAQGAADIEANAKMLENELPRMRLAPYMDAFNLYSSALGGEQARSNASLQPAFQGSQAATNAAISNYQNQLAYHQQRNQPQQRRGGFFSSLFGGF